MPAMRYGAKYQKEDEGCSVSVQQDTIKKISFFNQALALLFADRKVMFRAGRTSLSGEESCTQRMQEQRA